MAKKIGKALIFTAVAGAIAAGGVALYNKYKASTDDFDDDCLDFDDEDEDFDDDIEEYDDFYPEDEDEKSADREYVSIPRDTSKEDTSSDYKVNVDVTIDTTGFKADDDFSDSTKDVSETNNVNDISKTESSASLDNDDTVSDKKDME